MRDLCHAAPGNNPLKLPMVSKTKDSGNTRALIWFSRILRWTAGIFFLGVGYKYRKEDSSWMVILFGLVFFITGFLRPKRCLDDNCKIDP